MHSIGLPISSKPSMLYCLLFGFRSQMLSSYEWNIMDLGHSEAECGTTMLVLSRCNPEFVSGRRRLAAWFRTQAHCGRS